MSVKELIELFKQEGEVIGKAKFSFFSCVLAVGVVEFVGILAIVAWHYSGIIDAKEATNKQIETANTALKEDNAKLTTENGSLRQVGQELAQSKAEANIQKQEKDRFFQLYHDSESNKTRLKVELEQSETNLENLTNDLLFAQEEIRLRAVEATTPVNLAFYGYQEFQLGNYSFCIRFFNRAYADKPAWDWDRAKNAPYEACAILRVTKSQTLTELEEEEAENKFRAHLEEMSVWLNNAIHDPDKGVPLQKYNSLTAVIESLKRIRHLIPQSQSNTVEQTLENIKALCSVEYIHHT